MKKNEVIINQPKLPYVPPVIEVTLIEMESGIATGSATTVPSNINKEVMDEWEEDPNDGRNIIL